MFCVATLPSETRDVLFRRRGGSIGRIYRHNAQGFIDDALPYNCSFVALEGTGFSNRAMVGRSETGLVNR